MKSFIRNLALPSIFLACSALFSAQAAETLKVATSADFPPYESYNEKNEVVGFDIDIMNALAADMGVKLEWQYMNFDEIDDAIKSGKADCAISAIGITKERMEKYEFSKPYHMSGQGILINKKDIDTIHGFRDLQGKTSCVEDGSLAEELLGKYKDIKFKKYNTTVDLFKALDNKECDAVVSASPVLLNQIRLTGRKDIKMLDDIQQLTSDGIIVKKGNTALIERINTSLKNIKKSGTYAKIFKYWFPKN